jgi:hypothetical protein
MQVAMIQSKDIQEVLVRVVVSLEEVVEQVRLVKELMEELDYLMQF